MATIVSTRITRLRALSPRYTPPPSGAADWSTLTGKPSNLAALAGNEAIKNNLITLDSYGRITNIGDGALTSVSNTKLGLSSGGQLTYSGPSGSVNLGSATLGGLGAGSFAYLNQLNSSNIGSYLAANAIGSQYIDNVAANKITAGTLGAGVVYAGSISASNITTGTMSAERIAGGSYFSGTGTAAIAFGMSGLPHVYFRRVSGTPGLHFMYIADYGSNGTADLVRIDNQSASHSLRVEHSNAQHAAGFFYNSGTAKGVLAAYSAGYALYAPSNWGKFYATDGMGPFTGFHDALLDKNSTAVPGDIVIDDRLIHRLDVSNTLFEVVISSQPAQPGAIGVLSDVRELDAGVGTMPYEMWWQYQHTHDAAAINALGEGQINVCNEGGDIAAGDLIVTSSIPGKGMRQADDLVRSYTVARAREAVSFATPDEIKMVACVYLCG